MPRILLVDDSALIRNSMQNVLEPFGVELAHAENGAVAVEKACSSRWDLIFLDVVMPVMDGPTALKEIRGRGVKTPVVLVTSVSTASVVAAAVKLGGVHYIGKPFQPDMIRQLAVKLLKLDPTPLTTPPRVLLQTTDAALPKQLAKMLPAHVVIHAASSLGESLDLAAAHRPELAIFETTDLAEEGAAIAGVLRGVLPAAGIFAIDDSGTGEPWRPDGPLDGVLPRPLDPALGRGFLYPNFLRPLVFVAGGTAHAAGFQGAPAHFPAYLAMLERRLRARCCDLDLSLELQIDLRDLAADPEVIAAFVTRMNRELKDAGAAPAFRLEMAMSQATASQLAGVLMVHAT